jgi:UDP-N-acetylglucosamine transferase subunit ALG13
MIFVTVGTYDAPFDRLIRAVGELEVDEQIVVQAGASSVRLPHASSFDFAPFDEIVGQIRAARVVVAHAGAGTILIALANGRRPVVMPRLGRLGETSDDHQLPFARRLAQAGLVRLVETSGELAAAVREDGAGPAVGGGPLGAALRVALAEH